MKSSKPELLRNTRDKTHQDCERYGQSWRDSNSSPMDPQQSACLPLHHAALRNSFPSASHSNRPIYHAVTSQHLCECLSFTFREQKNYIYPRRADDLSEMDIHPVVTTDQMTIVRLAILQLHKLQKKSAFFGYSVPFQYIHTSFTTSK